MPLKALISSEKSLENMAMPSSQLATAVGATVTWDVPKPLLDFLQQLQHLNDVPFSCLVADPAQLPPESLRFFYVDPGWQRALVEGALSAASAGTSDDDERIEGYRDAVLDKLGKMPGGPTRTVTGFILRSAIVRYHPKLIVRGFDGDSLLTVLRFERLSQNILIVLWQGRPTKVEIEEPRTSAWFGVDRIENEYKLERKDDTGIGIDKGQRPLPADAYYTIRFRADSGARQVLDIARLAGDIAQQRGIGGVTSAEVGLQLQQQPYRQIFEGSGDPAGPRRGDLLDLSVVELNDHLRNATRRFGG